MEQTGKVIIFNTEEDAKKWFEAIRIISPDTKKYEKENITKIIDKIMED